MAGQGLDSLRERGELARHGRAERPGGRSRRFPHFRAMGNRLRLPWLVGAFVLFAAGGFLARRLAWWSARGLLAKILEAPGETAAQRVRLLGMRVSIAFYVLTAAVVGSLGAFLLFPWPPVFREMVLSLLGVFVMHGLWRLRSAACVIAPGARHDYFRVLPLSTPLAEFWYPLVDGASSIVFAIGGGGAQPAARRRRVLAAARDVIGTAWLGGAGRAADRDDLAAPDACRTRTPISRVVAVLLTMAVRRRPGCFAAMQARGAVLDARGARSLVPLLMGLVRDGRAQRRARSTTSTAPRTRAVIAWAVVVERAAARAHRHRRRVDPGQGVGRRPRRHRHGRDAFTRTVRAADARRHRAAGRRPRLAADPRADRRAARRRARAGRRTTTRPRAASASACARCCRSCATSCSCSSCLGDAC